MKTKPVYEVTGINRGDFTHLHLHFSSGPFAGTISDDDCAIDGDSELDFSEIELGDKLDKDFNKVLPDCHPYTCVACWECHSNEFSVTCSSCDRERESGDLEIDN